MAVQIMNIEFRSPGRHRGKQIYEVMGFICSHRRKSFEHVTFETM